MKIDSNTDSIINRINIFLNSFKELAWLLDIDQCEDTETALSKISESFTKILEDNLIRTTKNLGRLFNSSEILKFIYTYVLDYLAGAVSYVWDIVINDFLMGSVLGKFYAMATAIINAIPAGNIYIQYTQVKLLQDKLTIRRNILLFLRDQIYPIIGLLEWFLSLSLKHLNTNNDKIKEALKHINKAKFLLNIEIGLNSKDIKYTPTQQKVENIIKEIELAVKALEIKLPDSFDASLDYIIKRYNLKINSIYSIKELNTDKLVTYYFDLFKEAEKLSDSELKSLLYDLFPLLPSFISSLLFNDLFKISLKNINKYLPTLYNRMDPNRVSDNLDLPYDKLLSESFKDRLANIFGFENSKKNKVNNRFDTTVADITNEINMYKFIIMNYVVIWGLLETAASKINDLLKKVKNDLITVEEELKNNLNNKNLKHSKFYEWAFKLKTIESELSVIGSDYSGIFYIKKDSSIQSIGNILDLQNFIYIANNSFINLQKYITDNYEQSNKNIKNVFNTANAVIPELNLLGPYSLLVEDKKIITKLNSFRLALNTAINLDNIELSKINEYISIIENSPFFYKLDYLFNNSNNYFINIVNDYLINNNLLTAVTTIYNSIDSLFISKDITDTIECLFKNVTENNELSAIINNVTNININLSELEHDIKQQVISDYVNTKVLVDKLNYQLNKLIEINDAERKLND